jgi:hypothetical protein
VKGLRGGIGVVAGRHVLEHSSHGCPTWLTTSLKQLEDDLEEWYRIPQVTVQNLYKPITRRTVAVLKANVLQHHINKEVCTVSVVFPLFCSTAVVLSSSCEEVQTFHSLKSKVSLLQ